MLNLFLVGGGLAFSPATQTAGGAQALAAALVPAGLTPVAYFPPLATQQLQAVSVIFLEAPIGKRRKRHLKRRYYKKGISPCKGPNLKFSSLNVKLIIVWLHSVSSKTLFSDPWMLIDPSTPAREIFNYYTRNLRRITSMMQSGQLDKLLQPGKFSTEPPNNLELLLQYTDAHFGGLINSTKNK